MPWKQTTSGSGDGGSAFPALTFEAPKLFQLVHACSETQTAALAAEAPHEWILLIKRARGDLGRSGEI